MIKVYDYRCNCGIIRERFVEPGEKDDQRCWCGIPMDRLAPGTRTTFTFADKSGVKQERK